MSSTLFTFRTAHPFHERLTSRQRLPTVRVTTTTIKDIGKLDGFEHIAVRRRPTPVTNISAAARLASLWRRTCTALSTVRVCLIVAQWYVETFLVSPLRGGMRTKNFAARTFDTPLCPSQGHPGFAAR